MGASVLVRTRGEILLNLVVGVIGPALGGWFLSPLVGVSTSNQSNFSAAGLVVSFVGAIIPLALVDLVRRSTPR
jgi:uncharacterized membrane protein YeaQ/YmgE (transglycosylase-associated protein family)